MPADRQTLSRSRRLKAAAIAAVGTPVIAPLGRTYRWHETGTEHLDPIVAAGRQPIWTLWRSRRRKAAAVATVGSPVIARLGGTYRGHEPGTGHLDRIVAAGRQPLYALWHGRIMPGIIYLRDRDIAVITSENFDGDWIA